MTSECMKTGCHKQAEVQVCFESYAAGYPSTKRNRVEGETQLFLCAECGQEVKKEDLFPLPSWEQVCEVFRRAGKATPDYNRLSLFMKRIRKILQ